MISIDRSAGREALNLVVQQGDRLRRGFWIIMFPEGTRVAPGIPAATSRAAPTSLRRPGPKWCQSRTTPANAGRAMPSSSVPGMW